MGKGNGSGLGSGDYKGKTERVWFPALPIPLAIVCCVFNFLIPGLGSAIAGVSVFCCARNEDMDNSAKTLSCFASCGIGFLQLLTTVLLFIGWFWSCFWGVTYIMMSIEYYHNNRVDDFDRGTAVTTTIPTTHVVYENGAQNPSAVIMQPFVPYQVVQPGAKPGPSVTTHQPVAPPPYPGVGGYGEEPPPYTPGINPSGGAYPDPPLVRNADGSEHKLGQYMY